MQGFGKALSFVETPIAGLLLADLPVHGDSRGWFKENWQREKMTEAGLPDFGPVQNNVSFNDAVGTTRGIHAEPWDKWVSLASGRVFGAWVDLRDGPGFGTVFTTELDASRAVFVPRGVGNSYQTLDAATSYTYLVNDHWSADAEYSFLNLADETVAIAWPIPLADVAISAKDLSHPRLADATRVAPKRILVLGAGGQLGRALRATLGEGPDVEYATRDDIDLATSTLESTRRWQDYGVVVNAAAYTSVDGAETPEGRRQAWLANSTGVGRLVQTVDEHGIVLVHISTDYVFDGSSPRPYREEDGVCPLGVYGQTKAAGDAVVETLRRHYIIRTSWVVGDGGNFVGTMSDLAERGVDPAVVADQIGRLTFADELAQGIRHLITTSPAYGIYNITGGGEPCSWADIARVVFAATGHDPERVRPVSAEAYAADSAGPVAPRPRNSVLDLGRIEATGWYPTDSLVRLRSILSTAGRRTASVATDTRQPG